jgi:NAD-dependent dihydropyrimidine dehydrogenase PreA subunit
MTEAMFCSDLGSSISSEVASTSKKRRRFEVVIEEGGCKGCLLCVYACGKLGGDVLGESGERTSMGGVIPKVEGECIGCRWCERFCPDFAISVEEAGVC